MFKKKRRRRSEVRLGTKQAKFQATSTQPRVSLTPVLRFWQNRGATLTGLLVLGLLLWGLYALFTEPMFFIYGADIQGNVAVSSREIYLASGIHNQSIFWVDPATIRDNIAAMPNIKAATVNISLPASVQISVVERRPELLWQTGDALWWVDEEGTIVPPKTENTEGMLRIIDNDRQPLEAGYRIDSTIVQGAQMLRLLAPDLSTVRYSRAKGLTVATPEGWAVYLGSGTQIREKLVVLTAMLVKLREAELDPVYIDLRNPLQPVYLEKPVITIEAPPLIPQAPPPALGVPPGGPPPQGRTLPGAPRQPLPQGTGPPPQGTINQPQPTLPPQGTIIQPPPQPAQGQPTILGQ